MMTKTNSSPNPWRIQVDNRAAEILLYDEIGDEDFGGIGAKQFVDELQALGDVNTIDVRINSPGGSVQQGLAIYNALKRHPAIVNVFIDGVALSMASGIAMAGDTVEMADNALLMLHNPHAVAMGDAAEMERMVKMLNTTRSSLVRAYANKSGRDSAEISALMDAETWMTAEDALAFGFVDSINDAKQLAASFDVDKVSVPSRLRDVFHSLYLQEPTMATNQNKSAGVPAAATLQELEALNNSPAFIVNCLKEGNTLDQARDQLIVELRSDNKRLETIVAESQDELTTLRKAADNGMKEDTLRRQGGSQIPDPRQAQEAADAATHTQAAPQTAAPTKSTSTGGSQTEAAAGSVGNQPVNIGSAPLEAAPAKDFGPNPLAFFRAAKAEVKAEMKAAGKNLDPAGLLRAVNAKYPGIHEAMQAASSR